MSVFRSREQEGRGLWGSRVLPWLPPLELCPAPIPEARSPQVQGALQNQVCYGDPAPHLPHTTKTSSVRPKRRGPRGCRGRGVSSRAGEGLLGK